MSPSTTTAGRGRSRATSARPSRDGAGPQERGASSTFTQRPSYDATIRKHALGKFSDLLVAVSLHPAMLMYLNNYRSKAPRAQPAAGNTL